MINQIIKAVPLNAVATTTEQTATKTFFDILVMENESDADTLIFNLDRPIDVPNGDYFELKPGCTFENWPIVFTKIYYKSSANTVKFHIYGTNAGV